MPNWRNRQSSVNLAVLSRPCLQPTWTWTFRRPGSHREALRQPVGSEVLRSIGCEHGARYAPLSLRAGVPPRGARGESGRGGDALERGGVDAGRNRVLEGAGAEQRDPASMNVLSDLEEFVRDHRPHGRMTGDATQPAWNGYPLTTACACRVVFERWVTPQEGDEALVRLASLN